MIFPTALDFSPPTTTTTSFHRYMPIRSDYSAHCRRTRFGASLVPSSDLLSSAKNTYSLHLLCLLQHSVISFLVRNSSLFHPCPRHPFLWNRSRRRPFLWDLFHWRPFLWRLCICDLFLCSLPSESLHMESSPFPGSVTFPPLDLSNASSALLALVEAVLLNSPVRSMVSLLLLPKSLPRRSKSFPCCLMFPTSSLWNSSPIFYVQRPIAVHHPIFSCFGNLGTFGRSADLKFLSVSPSLRTGSSSSFTTLPPSSSVLPRTGRRRGKMSKLPNRPRWSAFLLLNHSYRLDGGIPSRVPVPISDSSCDVNKRLSFGYASSSRDGAHHLSMFRNSYLSSTLNPSGMSPSPDCL